MSSYFNLWIDTDRNKAVGGLSDSSLAQLPAFVQGDSLNFRLRFLRGFSRLGDYTPIPVAGLTAEMALGTRIGDETLYTQQFTWTASDDLADPYFYAVLPMNPPAITTLLGDEESALAWFEVKLLDGGLPRTVLSERVRIQASVIKEIGRASCRERV